MITSKRMGKYIIEYIDKFCADNNIPAFKSIFY